MPTISTFYGIMILMHLTRKEHLPPHIHAYYSDYEATFKICDGELLNGTFPEKGQKLVKEFILLNQDALIEMWETETYRKLPPLR